MIPMILTVGVSGAVAFILGSLRTSKEFEKQLNEFNTSMEKEKVKAVRDAEEQVIAQFSPFLTDVDSFTYENGEFKFVGTDGNLITQSTNKITKAANSIKEVDGEVYYEKSVYMVSHNEVPTKKRGIATSNELITTSAEDLEVTAKPAISKINGSKIIVPELEYYESVNEKVKVFGSVSEMEEFAANKPSELRSMKIFAEYDKSTSDYFLEGNLARYNSMTAVSATDFIEIPNDLFDVSFLYFPVIEELENKLIGVELRTFSSEAARIPVLKSEAARVGHNTFYRKVGLKNNEKDSSSISIDVNYLTPDRLWVKEKKVGILLTEDRTLHVFAL